MQGREAARHFATEALYISARSDGRSSFSGARRGAPRRSTCHGKRRHIYHQSSSGSRTFVGDEKVGGIVLEAPPSDCASSGPWRTANTPDLGRGCSMKLAMSPVAKTPGWDIDSSVSLTMMKSRGSVWRPDSANHGAAPALVTQRISSVRDSPTRLGHLAVHVSFDRAARARKRACFFAKPRRVSLAWPTILKVAVRAPPDGEEFAQPVLRGKQYLNPRSSRSCDAETN